MSDDEDVEYGQHFGKWDIERSGFFNDSPPGPFGEYQDGVIGGGLLRSCLIPGRQMMCNLKGDLFEYEFRRIFTGECLVDPNAEPVRRGRKKPRKIVPVVTEKLKPAGTPKLHSTPGDWYGCIGRQPKHFSPELKDEEPAKPPSTTFTTKPNPYGGPGYLNITLNPYVPVHDGPEPYDPDFLPEPKPGEKLHKRNFVNTCTPQPYFDLNPYKEIVMMPRKKWRRPPPPRKKPQPTFYLNFPQAPLGRLSGCFSRFPVYRPDTFNDGVIPSREYRGPKVLRPACGPDSRSKYTESIIDKITKVACNANNFAEYREQVYPLS